MSADVSNVNGMTWLYGMWFVGDNKSVDWFATLGTRDGKATLEYRFRYYKDDKAHGSKDKKNWFCVQAPDDSPKHFLAMKDTIDSLRVILESRFGNPIDFIDLQCEAGDPKVFFEMGSRSWAHLQTKPN